MRTALGAPKKGAPMARNAWMCSSHQPWRGEREEGRRRRMKEKRKKERKKKERKKKKEKRKRGQSEDE